MLCALRLFYSISHWLAQLSLVSVNISNVLHRDIHMPPENLISLLKSMVGSIETKKGKKTRIFIKVILSDWISLTSKACHL